MSKPLRVKEAASILKVSPGTVRNWCNEGRLEYSYSAANQRVFDAEYLRNYYNEKLGNSTIETVKSIVYYVRSSDGNDVTMNTQLEKLTSEYGIPDKIFKDKSSGLNDNRRGLNSLIEYIKDNPSIIHITNKDRITRFGYNYITKIVEAYDSSIIILDSDDTKESHEIMMQDFMSIIASYAGKFYRLRGNEQKKKLVRKVSERLENNE